MDNKAEYFVLLERRHGSYRNRIKNTATAYCCNTLNEAEKFAAAVRLSLCLSAVIAHRFKSSSVSVTFHEET